MMLAWLQTSPSTVDQLSGINTPLAEYVEVLLVLTIVLGLAYVSLRYVLPRMFGLRVSNDGPIQVLTRFALEPRKMLYVVKVGSQTFLLGTSESQMECLTALTPDNATEILASTCRKPTQRKEFRQLLDWVQKIRKADC